VPQHVCNGATIKCAFAVPPGIATLIVLPENRVNVGGQPAATVMDHIPLDNIPTFGMCMTLSNPEVATATTAALGVLTPQPCLPVVAAPWEPGAPTVMVDGMPALDNTSMAECEWGGVITVMVPGQMTVMVP
jgi:uncharacterized Zn-binding protein involved in type VI secretion